MNVSVGYGYLVTVAALIGVSFGEFPWMALITVEAESNIEYYGQGVLISNNAVLTAAHLVPYASRKMKIRLGDHHLATSQDRPQYENEEFSVQAHLIHPEYNVRNLHNDVALLYLTQPFNINHTQLPNIGSVSLPEPGKSFYSQSCLVIGWGQFTLGQFHSTLKKVNVQIWDPNDCQKQLRRTVLGTHFNLNKKIFLCAGGDPKKDINIAERGAPLVCKDTNGRFTVVGIASWGLRNQTSSPEIYVNVANYVNFIKQLT